MSQEENPAMAAARHTPPQIRSASQHGPQDDVVLPHQSPYLTLSVPIPAELKMLLDCDN